MPSRKRTSQGEDVQQLPLREKRRRTKDADEEQDDEDSLSRVQEPIANRGLRSNHVADVSIQLDDHGAVEVASKLHSKKKSHVRFGSQDPPAAPIVEEKAPADGEEEEDEEEDEDSDDEAPEEVMQSSAAAQLKAELADQARLAKDKEQKERDKRRTRDKLNKAQVKTSEKRRRKAEDEEDEEAAASRGGKKKSKNSRFDLNNLPNLLPEELLATEAPERAPTPPLTTLPKESVPATTTPTKKKTAEQPPADVVHDGKRIRVLPKTNTALPPKVNKQSRHMKAQWQARPKPSMTPKKGKVPMIRRRPVGAVPFV